MIKTVSTDCLLEPPPDPPTPEELLKVGEGECKSGKDIAGCLSPAGGVKLLEIIQYGRDAWHRCGEMKGSENEKPSN